MLLNSAMLVDSDLFDYGVLATSCRNKFSEALGCSDEQLFDSFRVSDGLKRVCITNTNGPVFGLPLVQRSIGVARRCGDNQPRPLLETIRKETENRPSTETNLSAATAERDSMVRGI